MGQSVSTAQWFVYGRRHFTQTGYQKHAKSYSSPVQTSSSVLRGADGADGVDLSDRVVVVTGANSGLGKEIATYAAAKGARLYMMCRSRDRAEAARDEIKEKTSNDNIEILLADVGELDQVRKAAEELSSRESEVHCLVCNAGVLLNERRETSDGYEVTFAAHLLGGSYLLSKLLLPRLKAAGSGARVIFVTSGGMYLTKFPTWEVATNDRDGGGKYDGTDQYTYAKRGQVLLAERMAKVEPDVKWVTGHPGWASTAAVDDAFGSDKKYLEPMRTTWEGAEGLTWLMSTGGENLQNGALYLDRTVQRKHMAGPFMSEGSYTKNKEEEVDEMMENLKKACGS